MITSGEGERSRLGSGVLNQKTLNFISNASIFLIRKIHFIITHVIKLKKKKDSMISESSESRVLADVSSWMPLDTNTTKPDLNNRA